MMSQEQFYRNYEIQLIESIVMLQLQYKNNENDNFYNKQIELLKERLDFIQNKINIDYENTDKEIYYSLRSWIEHYLKCDYKIAYNFAKEHCNNIKNKYVEKYNKNPIKLCKEWIYNKDNSNIKEVLVNSFSKLEFMDIVKPYIDLNYTQDTI